MHKTALFICLYVGFTPFLFSQNKNDENIISINGEGISIEEFQNVYSKNLELVQDENQKDREIYLDLFINYKLKVKEAIEQGLDKEQAFLKEFRSYQTQLSESYLYDQKITKELVLEAFERMYEEVNANHILILVGENAKS
ncbi:MAG: peptidylprolyl isomerase, partial [Flavobacteriales bacterium]|nr:peptidylprolyl isomerase [Flavobacteriales bacterium]